MSGVEIRHLEHALALDSHRHFHRAAQALGITQSALSRSIQALEAWLSVPLFDRRPNSVTPTVYGVAILKRAQEIVARTSALSDEIDHLKGLSFGELSIGTGAATAGYFVATAVGRLLSAHPGLRISVRNGSLAALLAALRGGAVDCFVADCEQAEKEPDVEVEPLPQRRIALYCRADHPLTKLEKVRPSDLVDYPLALGGLPPRLSWLVDSRRLSARSVGRPPAATLLCDDVAFAKTVVLEGSALSICVHGQIAGELRAGLLVELELDSPPIFTRYGFARLKGQTAPPAYDAFTALAREAEREAAEPANECCAAHAMGPLAG
jgi:DNA-binding transcriptional LysR family regulator